MATLATLLSSTYLGLVVVRVALLAVLARGAQRVLERRWSEELVEDDGRHQRRLQPYVVEPVTACKTRWHCKGNRLGPGWAQGHGQAQAQAQGKGQAQGKARRPQRVSPTSPLLGQGG